MPHVVTLGAWRWYSDAATDGAMAAQAAQNAAPTLTGAQMQNSILRLRFQLSETGGTSGSGAVTLAYRESSSAAWTGVEAQTPANNKEGIWLRYANGAAAAGATVGSQLLSGTTASGTYIESSGVSASVAANAVAEYDVALLIHWPPPDRTITIQVSYGGGAIGTLTLVTSTAANRPYTVVSLDGDASQKTTREVRFAPWRRVFYDPVGARWWLFTVQYNTPTIVRSYYWSGSGAWTAGATFTAGSSTNCFQTRAAFHAVVTGSGLTVYTHHGSSGTTRRFQRGTISGTALTWGTEQTLSQSTDRHTHLAVDDGGYVWIAGTTAGSGVWARRATSTDSVSAWGSAITATDTAVVSGDILAVVGLASDKALLLWRPNATSVVNSVVMSAGAAGSVVAATATAAASNEDWGVVRTGGKVYLVHSDATGAGGNWVLRIFNEATQTWSTGASPGVSGQPSSNDGIALTTDGSNIYAIGTFAGPEGGQDRIIRYKAYNIAAGTWGALTTLGPGESRGNSDHVVASADATPGYALVLSAFNDDDAVYNARTIEYHQLTTAAPSYNGTATMSGSGTVGAAGSAAVPGSASPAGDGTVGAAGSAAVPGSASPAGSGALASATAIAAADAAALTGAGTLAADGVAAMGGAAASAGTGTLAAVGQATLTRAELPTPTRAAFYYPWFPETWTVGGQPIKYSPTLGLYNLDAAGAAAVYDQHIAWLEAAGIKLVILSWWAQDDGNPNLKGTDHNEGTRIPLFLSRIAALGSSLKVCMYYETEGSADPSVAQLTSDLNYLAERYTHDPAYLWRDNKPVIFVYNSGDNATTNCLARWDTATNGHADWYVVAKVFSGYTTATPQPSSWHQYGPASRSAVHSPYSHVVSPGYWQANDPGQGDGFPYLVRDPAAYAAAVRAMVANTGVEWHLITTFNEWGEGTAIEPAAEFGTLYLDVLAANGGVGSFTGTGQGTLTAATSVGVAGAAAVSASGALAADGAQGVAGAAAPSGTGALAADGVAGVAGAAALAGTGTLAADGQAVIGPSAALDGSGALTAVGAVAVAGAAAPAGAGALAAAGTDVAAATTAALDGSGALATAGLAGAAAGAALTGVGALSADGVAVAAGAGAASLAGAGALNADGELWTSWEASASGDGGVQAAGSPALSRAAAAASAGSLAATADVALAAAAGRVGVGGLTATATATLTAVASLGAAGGLASSGQVRGQPRDIGLVATAKGRRWRASHIPRATGG